MNRSDRRYFGFVLAAFTALGLAVLGAWLYGPLKFKYALGKARRTDYHESRRVDKWLLICINEACKGNREAIDLVISKSELGLFLRSDALSHIPTLDARECPDFCDVTYPVAVSQPEAFLQVLGGRADGRVLWVLWRLSGSRVFTRTTFLYKAADQLAGYFERHRNSPPERAMTAATVDFLRRRFPEDFHR